MDGDWLMSFFKNIDGSLDIAPNFVLNKDYELVKESKDTYEYPVDGWYWFDTEVEAYEFFNIPLPVEEDGIQ
jgi:hypothetical protein